MASGSGSKALRWQIRAMSDDLDTDDKPKDDEEKARRWLKIIATYDREFKNWHTRSEKIIKIYTEKRRTEGTEGRHMTLLGSITSPRQPAIYPKMPTPMLARGSTYEDRMSRTAPETG